MSDYVSMNREELEQELSQLQEKYRSFQEQNLKLDLSRGKPGADQTDLSVGMLDELNSKSDFKTESGVDCRNYGLLDGLPEMKEIFGHILDVPASQVFVGGNSSLNLMFDTISCLMTHGVAGCEPWCKQGNVKFLCPVPGYDRHFGVTEYFGIEMINIPMDENGPDMDEVERLVQSDASIKGMWCIPKYSNPSGITYSDDVVRRLASLKPAAKDFRIIWDNAYCVHDLTDTPDHLLNIMEESKKYGNEDLFIQFCSTSKITFPGAGVAAFAASDANMAVLKKRYATQTIGFDKLNQLRHVRYFKNYDGFLEHMKLHREILEPKFAAVLNNLEQELGGKGVARWTKPNGGYFISVDGMDGCAKRVVELCKEAGVVFTPAGATYPYGKDPKDSNIRLAPTYPPVAELETAMKLFCLCVELAAVEKLLGR